MDLIAIIGIAVGLMIVVLLIVVDEAFYKLFGWLFTLFGLQSGKGPLIARVSARNERLELTIENRGKHKVRLAAVEARDGSQKRHFPTPCLDEQDLADASDEGAAHKQFATIVLDPGEARIVFLDPAELASLDCRTLSILDSNGRAWPVEGSLT